MLTQQHLKSILHYNIDSGQFFWKKSISNRIKIGHVAGCYGAKGYIIISIERNRYQAHRLAWLYVYGSYPSCEVDHKNQIKHDNRISNLRLSSNSQNRANSKRYISNTSGYKGVSWHKQCKKWRSYITFQNKTLNLGLFKNKEDAYLAYCNAAKVIHGEFASFY